MGKVSQFLIRGTDGFEIAAGGMRDWDSLTLQRLNQFDRELLEPMQICRVATVEGEKCSDFVEGVWYQVTAWRQLDNGNYELTEWKRMETESQGSSQVTQTFHGPVQNAAGHDVISTQNVTSTIMLQSLITAIEQDPRIPADEKESLLEQLRAFARNPYVSGLATAGLLEALKHVLG